MSVNRVLWLALGSVATGLGILGAVLPLLPTTPLLLLATFAFSRSSPRVHSWLVAHPRFGPPIRDWQRHRAIAGRAKVAALVAMIVTLLAGVLMGIPGWILVVQAVALLIVAVFILTRPSAPVPGSALDAPPPPSTPKRRD